MSRHYTKIERADFCRKYLTGKKTRQVFCEANDINPKSLSRWLLESSKASDQKFIPMGELAVEEDVLLEINLPNKIDIKLRVKEKELSCLLKGLL